MLGADHAAWRPGGRRYVRVPGGVNNAGRLEQPAAEWRGHEHPVNTRAVHAHAEGEASEPRGAARVPQHPVIHRRLDSRPPLPAFSAAKLRIQLSDLGVQFRRGNRLQHQPHALGLRSDPGTGALDGRGGDISADEPEGLPWLVRLDKFVDGQNHDGVKELVVRSNISETALNEAVATELLELAELASQKAIAARFSVNDSEAVLRLVIEHPDDMWMAANFSAGGALYKAESTGDYSYRGSDPSSYDEVFDQEAGKKNADLTPLIDFLDFINNTDDTTFYSTLADRLDVESFATYLAMEEMLGNFDDIDGPGNNSYLYYDPATDRFTVVAWDHNLAFGGMGEMGGNAPGADRVAPDSVAPDSVAPGRAGPGGMAPGRMAPDRSGLGDMAPDRAGHGGMGFGPGGKSNKLVERFHANSKLEALYEERLADLKTKLFESGVGAEVLARWVTLLETQASDLVDAATIKTEAAKIGSYFTTDQAAARGS